MSQTATITRALKKRRYLKGLIGPAKSGVYTFLEGKSASKLSVLRILQPASQKFYCNCNLFSFTQEIKKLRVGRTACGEIEFTYFTRSK